MTQEEKEAISYARERLSIDDYPVYNDEYELMLAFEAGAEWRQSNLWHPADGDDLPEIDREVIALVGLDGSFEIQNEEPHELSYKVVFAHRPPEYWDGKNILTGEVTRYKPKRYDKGGWNMPNIKYWLNVDLPKIEGGDV